MKEVIVKITENGKTLVNEIYEYVGQNENYIYLKGRNGFTHYQIKPLFGQKMSYQITIKEI